MIASLFRKILVGLSLAAVLAEPGIANAQQFDGREDALVSEIDRQADAIFEELHRRDETLPIDLFKRTKREATYRLRQMGVLTDILKASGKGPALTLIAGEIIPTFMLAPMFAAKGNLLMASAMLTLPWGIVGAAGFASFEMMKNRFKLAREIGTDMRTLRELDRIRKVVLGYDVKHRISTVMLESMKEEFKQEFEVVKKMKTPETMRTPFVTVNELAAIVKSQPEGAAFLQQIYFEQLDRGLYAALMLRYLNEQPELVEQLLELLKVREPAKGIENVGLRKHLLAVDDAKKAIARDMRSMQKETKELKKRVKDATISKEQAKVAKNYLKEEIVRLQAARSDVARHEYALLLDIKSAYESGDQARVETLAKEYAPTLAAIRLASRHQRLELLTYKPPVMPLLTKVIPFSPRMCLNLFAGLR